MARGKRKPTADKSQRERFIETARKVEADESDEEFERKFKELVPPKKD